MNRSFPGIDLEWTDNADNESGFSIERKTGAGGTYEVIDTVAADVTSYSDTGLAPSTTYYYRVLAYNTGGDSAYSNEDSATTQEGGTMHVDSITVEWISAGGPNQKGQATVVIKDNLGNPVSGATVSGTFSGTLSESASGTTNSAGTVVIQTVGKTRSPGSLTFCVDNVTHTSLTYNPSDNMETCDGI
ncbi:MAG: fibronectin type III domain-containing protein [Planctomycetota bacterium]